nr:MAG TPA_asm: hypothetical protein [Caudoviricetes sp.]
MSSKIDYTRLDLSPLEDEGIDYIWFARYFEHNFIKFESNNDKVKLEFDSIYKDRDLIREFGLIGKSRKISIFLNDGLFRLNGQDVIHLHIKTTDDRLINISNNMDCKYTDIITKKHINGIDDKGKPIISPISFGYTTEIKDQYVGIFNATVLYNIYKDHDSISVHLTSIDPSIQNSSIVLVHPYFNFNSDESKLNKIDGGMEFEVELQIQ